MDTVMSCKGLEISGTNRETRKHCHFVVCGWSESESNNNPRIEL